MKLEIEFAGDTRLEKLSLALVDLGGLDWGAAVSGSGDGFTAPLSAGIVDAVFEGARDKGSEGWTTRIKAVRDLLRNGSYKPAGRAKPSSEYLLAAALDGDFPRVNFFVDAVNLASLKYMYPMSIFDADRAGSELLCRLGAPGERYVFNGAGQEIDVEDLICICARGVPIVNPVRDSMATKLFESARNAVVAIYAPRGAEGCDLAAAAADVARWCGRACARTETSLASLS